MRQEREEKNASCSTMVALVAYGALRKLKKERNGKKESNKETERKVERERRK